MAKSYTVDEFKDAFTDNLSQYFVSNIRWRVKDDQVVVASYKRLS
ncbi:MAG: hypothetical protein ABF709_10265 [Leuconostoc pseudomesenteroides]